MSLHLVEVEKTFTNLSSTVSSERGTVWEKTSVLNEKLNDLTVSFMSRFEALEDKMTQSKVMADLNGRGSS
jgi:hypothetical protein